ncbi:MAG: cbb3-type cytochrome c oxidase subunit I [Acidimicrobiia bacterium]
MLTGQSSDIRALLGGGADGDRLATAHILVGALYLLVGGVLALFALLSLRFPEQSPISYGQVDMMSATSLMLGFGVLTMSGGIYYVLPRLTGARLALRGIAGFGLVATAGLTALGVISIPLGLGDGGQPLGLAWWLDIPIAAVLAIPLVVTLATVRDREEKRSYVTVWFILGGVVWLPLLYASSTVGSLPFANSLSTAFSGVFLSAGFVNMWLLVIGFGLFYYTVVKELDIPLASRQLALVGFWSLGFASAWWGASQLIFGPGPDWLDGVAAALGLALPIGAIANAANFSVTLEDSWRDLPDNPGLSSGVIGSYFAVVVAGLAAFAGFPSIGAAASLTAYWDGIEYAALLGIGPLLAAGFVFPAMPRLTGRAVPNLDRVRSFNKFTVIGSGGVLLTLVTAGLYTGYSWIGGSNGAAYVDVGEGWASGGGSQVVSTLILLAVGFGVVSLLAQFAYAGVVFGTLTTGKTVPQEVLVTRGEADE